MDLIPGTTLTDGIPKIPGLITRLIHSDFKESTKRWVLIASAIVLMVGFEAIAIACAVRIIWKGDVGSGAVAALVCVSGPLAILAGASYRKKEEPPKPE